MEPVHLFDGQRRSCRTSLVKNGAMRRVRHGTALRPKPSPDKAAVGAGFPGQQPATGSALASSISRSGSQTTFASGEGDQQPFLRRGSPVGGAGLAAPLTEELQQLGLGHEIELAAVLVPSHLPHTGFRSRTPPLGGPLALAALPAAYSQAVLVQPAQGRPGSSGSNGSAASDTAAGHAAGSLVAPPMPYPTAPDDHPHIQGGGDDLDRLLLEMLGSSQPGAAHSIEDVFSPFSSSGQQLTHAALPSSGAGVRAVLVPACLACCHRLLWAATTPCDASVLPLQRQPALTLPHTNHRSPNSPRWLAVLCLAPRAGGQQHSQRYPLHVRPARRCGPAGSPQRALW